MITFRSPIWDSFLEFLDKLRRYPQFETMDNGRYKNRLDMVYERATDRMRLDRSDLDLISKTFIFLSEKNISPELVEYMNECSVLGYKCVSTSVGEKIIREAEAEVKQRNAEKLVRQLRDEKQREFEEAKKAYDEYMASQNNIVDRFERIKEELEESENRVKELLESKKTEEVKEVKTKKIIKAKADDIESDDSTGAETEEAEGNNE